MPLTWMWLIFYVIISFLTIEQESSIYQWLSGHCQYSAQPNQDYYTVFLKSRNCYIWKKSTFFQVIRTKQTRENQIKVFFSVLSE